MNVCPRCNGAYGSLLHAYCELDTQLAERSEGWRLSQVRSPYLLMQLGKSSVSAALASRGTLVSR